MGSISASMLISFLTIPMTAIPAKGDDLRPLTELIENSARPYATTRCAAFYQAVLSWAGVERLGPESAASSIVAIQTLTSVAALAFMQDNPSLTAESAVKNVVRDVKNIEQFYQHHFETRYALHGEAWNGDPLFASDLELCTTIAEYVLSKLP